MIKIFKQESPYERPNLYIVDTKLGNALTLRLGGNGDWCFFVMDLKMFEYNDTITQATIAIGKEQAEFYNLFENLFDNLNIFWGMLNPPHKLKLKKIKNDNTFTIYDDEFMPSQDSESRYTTITFNKSEDKIYIATTRKNNENHKGVTLNTNCGEYKSLLGAIKIFWDSAAELDGVIKSSDAWGDSGKSTDFYKNYLKNQRSL